MWVNVCRMPRAWVREVVPIVSQGFGDGSRGVGVAAEYDRDNRMGATVLQRADQGVQTDFGAEIADGGFLRGTSAIGGAPEDVSGLNPQSHPSPFRGGLRIFKVQVSRLIFPAPRRHHRSLQLANRLISKGLIIRKSVK